MKSAAAHGQSQEIERALDSPLFLLRLQSPVHFMVQLLQLPFNAISFWVHVFDNKLTRNTSTRNAGASINKTKKRVSGVLLSNFGITLFQISRCALQSPDLQTS